MVFVGKDCWTIIASYGLSEKDLLSLRQTCKYMNNIIKNTDRFNERWFRAFQFFESKNGKLAKIKSPVLIHPHVFSYRCVPDNHPSLKGIYSYYQRESLKMQIFSSGFKVEECKHRFHWVLKVPETRDEMPMTGYKKTNSYIYWYLIECYREKKNQIRTSRNYNLGVAKRLEAKVVKYEAAKRKAEELDEELNRNLIFEKAKVMNYDGP